MDSHRIAWRQLYFSIILYDNYKMIEWLGHRFGKLNSSKLGQKLEGQEDGLMRRGIPLTFALAGCVGMSSLALAQTTGDRVDLYFADWHNAKPRSARGSLQERDILTRGDA